MVFDFWKTTVNYVLGCTPDYIGEFESSGAAEDFATKNEYKRFDETK